MPIWRIKGFLLTYIQGGLIMPLKQIIALAANIAYLFPYDCGDYILSLESLLSDEDMRKILSLANAELACKGIYY